MGNSIRQHGDSAGSPTDPKPWPYCETFGGICPLHNLSEALGDDVLETLATFAIASEPGARLVLQRNPEGFSTQVTEPVYRGISGTAGLSRLHTLRGKLDTLMREE